jgi:CheY-like chemotaxis protein
VAVAIPICSRTTNKRELMPESVAPRGLKLLLADDEPSILVTLRMILISEGFDVHTAASAKAAKAALVQISFDVIVTDLSMESTTAGYEVVHAARTQTRKPATLVLSGFPRLLDQ